MMGYKYVGIIYGGCAVDLSKKIQMIGLLLAIIILVLAGTLL